MKVARRMEMAAVMGALAFAACTTTERAARLVIDHHGADAHQH